MGDECTGLQRTGKRPVWWAQKISIYPTDQGFMTCLLVVVEKHIRKKCQSNFNYVSSKAKITKYLKPQLIDKPNNYPADARLYGDPYS